MNCQLSQKHFFKRVVFKSGTVVLFYSNPAARQDIRTVRNFKHRLDAMFDNKHRDIALFVDVCDERKHLAILIEDAEIAKLMKSIFRYVDSTLKV
ncbi:MAG: hypothetical protein KGI70_02625 [Patescibacteria group bacterium]|nr:hypothetical protein [Patescibacteria group bacterium]